MFQTLDVLLETELDAQGSGHLRQTGGEELAVTGLVVGQTQGPTELVRDLGQGGFDPCDTGAIEQFVRHAGALQHGDVLGRCIQLGLSAEQLRGTELAPFVGDTGFGAQLVEAVATVLGQSHHALLVHRITRRSAVAQHLRHPQVLVDITGKLDGQRRMTLQQPLHRLQRHTRRGPGRGITRRHLAGIGEAGFHCHGRLPIDHNHLETGPRQIVGAGGADDSATQYQYTHCSLPPARTGFSGFTIDPEYKKAEAVLFTI